MNQDHLNLLEDSEEEATTPIVVNLNDSDISKFEQLLADLLDEYKLGKVTFNRKLKIEEKRVLNNLYVAELYYHNHENIEQIQELANNLNISLNFKFEYKFNSKVHNVELEGYFASNVLDEQSVANIEHFKKYCYTNFMSAIENNDLNLVKQYFYFGMNINTLYDGRIPLEFACQLEHIEIAGFLLQTCNADSELCNYDGVNAIMQCCINENVTLLKKIAECEDTSFVNFLDYDNEAYAPEVDVIKIIIDLEKVNFFEQLIRNHTEIPEPELLDSSRLQHMLDYAAAENKLQMVVFLTDLHATLAKLEKDFIHAISENDMDNVKRCLSSGVNINKQIDNFFPFELACNKGHIEIVDILLKLYDLAWSNYELQFSDNFENAAKYNARLDPIKIAIQTDNAQLLKLALIQIEGDPDYIHYGESRINEIYQEAYATVKPSILTFIQELENQKLHDITRLFDAVISGDPNAIGSVLLSEVKINSQLNGKTITHVACELNHSVALNYILTCENIDINIPDNDGQFPITIACQNGNFNLVRILLGNELIRVNGFNEEDMPSYNPSLDLIRIAVDNDDAEMLENLLRHSQAEGILVVVNYENICYIRDYAFSKERNHCLRSLNSYVTTLSASDVLFEIKEKSAVKELVDNPQGIQRVESSFISSIKRLCKRYSLSIEPTENNKYLTLRFNTDKYQLLHSLERMIAQANDTKYLIGSKEQNEACKAEQYLSDEVYRSYATDTYRRLQTSLDPSPPDKWHTAWCQSGEENITSNKGLLSAEIWCLAILAAQDKNALPGKILTDLDIFDREQILVRTLVECRRAYAYDSDYLDSGGDARESCEHGVAVRSFLALCGLHSDIVIAENPLEWAAEVARDTLTQIYLNSQRRDDLSSLLKIHAFQLAGEQEKIVDEFYAEAYPKVEAKLIDELGMVSGGGYLRFEELKRVLESLRYINLPLADEESISVKRVNFAYADFAQIQTPAILNDEYKLMLQYKLPNTADSMYAAILISALNMQLNVPQCTNVQQLRNEVAFVLETALNTPEKFQTLLYTSLRKCIINNASSNIICRIIKHKYESMYPADKGTQHAEYLYAVRNYSAPDFLVLMIISAIYGCTIATYDLKGTYNLQINSSSLSLQTKSTSSLHVCCMNVIDGQRSHQDYGLANALVTAGDWDQMLQKIKTMGINSVKERLSIERRLSNDYQIMHGRRFAGMDQIKIPGDGDCAFNAVFIACRQASIQNSLGISTVEELRTIVQHELGIMLESALQTGESSEQNIVLSYIDDAIVQYNEQFSQPIRSRQDYVQAIGRTGTWGSELELRIMARMLGIIIDVYSTGRDIVNSIGDAESQHRISVLHTINHYNVLVPAGTWHGVEILGIQSAPSVKRALLSV